jgi:hypothetical protein
MLRLHACEQSGDGFVVGMIQGDGDRLAPCPNDPEPSPQMILIISRPRTSFRRVSQLRSRSGCNFQ